MEILIRPDAQTATELVARVLEARLLAKPDLVLGCATGRTMEGLYAALARRHAETGLNFSQCKTFNLDEYVGLAPSDPRSYHAYMYEHFFRHVNLNPKNTFLPNGVAAELKQEARDYEGRIAAAGGIDVQLLGLGESGHIGFNEPLSSLMSRTRDKALTPTTKAQNAQFFADDPDNVPPRALTMGVGTILEAREIIMLVLGENKAAMLASATEGPITAMISATALQLHPNCKVIVDEGAAAHLQGQAYYRWIFDNEPEWQAFH